MENQNEAPKLDPVEVVRNVVALNDEAGNIKPYASSIEELDVLGPKLVGAVNDLKEVAIRFHNGEEVDRDALNKAFDAQSLESKFSGLYDSIKGNVDHLASISSQMRMISLTEGPERLAQMLDESRQIAESGLAVQYEAEMPQDLAEFFTRHGKTFVPYVPKSEGEEAA